MEKYPNRVPLSVTESRINKLPINSEQYRVDAPGPNGDENRCPTDCPQNKKK